jgi:hypothetical protein
MARWVIDSGLGAREFDVGTPVYNTNMPGPEVRRALRLPEAGAAS